MQALRGAPEIALRAVDFVRQTQLLPRHDAAGLNNRDQGPGALGELRMCGKESLDLPGACHAESLDGFPPATPAGNAHGQRREGVDTVRLQCPDGPRRQPLVDAVADLGLRRRQRGQEPDRAFDGTRAPLSLFGGVLEHVGQIRPVAAVGENDELAADMPQHPSR